MKTFTPVPLAVALLLSFDVAAQDHSQHQMTMPASQAQPMPEHSQHRPAKPRKKPKPTPTPPAADHAAMGHAQPEAQSTLEGDHAATSHDMSLQPPGEMDHAAMGHTMPRAHDQPRTPIPELTDADRAAARPPAQDHPVHDNAIHSFVLLDRLEAIRADEGNGVEWQAQAWFGTDHNKLWLRSEGERIAGDIQDADLELLYGRSVARWWDVVAGARHHFEPGKPQDYAVLGVTGKAPYKFEVNASLYIGGSGYTGARVEVEYEALLTNRLILQPALEANLHSRVQESHDNGAGLGTIEGGLRLRYEVTRQFAPYIGVVRERAYGRTAELRRADGQDIDDTRIVAGLRIWF